MIIEPVEKLRKRARAAYKAGDFGAAADYYDLVQRHPEHVHSAEQHLEHALALIRSGRPEEAATVLGSAAKLDPENDDVRSRLGHLLLRLGHTGAALENFREAARSAPGVADHYWQISMIERSVGNEAAADEAVDACLIADSGHPQAQASLGERGEPRLSASGTVLPFGSETGDAALASVAQFVHSRPVEDAKPPPITPGNSATSLLTALAGAVAFIVLYVWVRSLLF